MAFYSLRKQVPVPDGAVLVLRHPWLLPDEARPGDRAGAAALKLAVMLAERLAFTAGLNLLPLKQRLATRARAAGGAAHGDGDGSRVAHSDGNPPGGVANGAPSRPGNGPGSVETAPGASRLIPMLLRRIDWGRLIARRQQVCRQLADRLRNVPGITLPLPTFRPGSVPQALPIWVDDPAGVVAWLRRAGIEATRWPGDEQIEIDRTRFPGACNWLARSVTLPVSDALRPRHLDRMASAVEDAVRRTRSVDTPRALRYSSSGHRGVEQSGSSLGS